MSAGPISFSTKFYYGDRELRDYTLSSGQNLNVTSWDMGHLPNYMEHGMAWFSYDGDTFSGNAVGNLYDFTLNHSTFLNISINNIYKANITLGDGGNSNLFFHDLFMESSITTGNGNDSVIIHTPNSHRSEQSSGVISMNTGAGHDDIYIKTNTFVKKVYSAADIEAGEGNDKIRIELLNADTVDGGAGNDTIYTGGGNDILIGGAGRDILNGAKGFDTAEYQGDFDNYRVLKLNDFSLGIIDLTGQDGVDIVTNVENFSFNDGDKFIHEIISVSDNRAIFNYSIDDYDIDVSTSGQVTFTSDIDGSSQTFSDDNMFYFNDATINYEQLSTYANNSAYNITIDGIQSNQTLGTLSHGDFLIHTSRYYGADDTNHVLTLSNLNNVVEFAYIQNYDHDQNNMKIWNFTINSGDGDDYFDISWGHVNINAGDGDDYIESGWRDDVINGGGGNDYIDGGNDYDIAIYSGNLSDYVIKQTQQGTIVADLRGNDGVDLVVNVENFSFADDNYTQSQILQSSNNDYAAYFGGVDDFTYTFLQDGSVEVYSKSDDTLISTEAEASLFTFTDRTFSIHELEVYASGDGIQITTDNQVLSDDLLNSFFYQGAFFADSASFSPVNNQDYTIQLNNIENHVTIDNIHNFNGDTKLSDFEIEGGEQNDTITIQSGFVTVNAGAGDDVISTGSGDDTISGGIGNDIIDGGDGKNDTVDYSGSSDYVYVNLKVGLVDEGRNSVWNDTITNIESAIGSLRSDKIIGNDLDNVLSGLSGDDNIFAYGGDDIVHGGEGNDRLYSGTGQDHLYGDEGRDILYGDEGTQTMHGGSGNDTILGKQGDDFIYGDDDDDKLYGDEGADTIEGGSGRDYVHGGIGNDIIDGGDHVDVLYGEQGDDTIRGGEGVDYIYGDFQTTPDGILVSDGNSYNDTLYGDGGNDIIKAGAGNDIVYGGTGNDQIVGHDGQDRLYGDNGSDFIYGGYGNDQLNGNTGQDRLYGDEGNDRLYFGEGADYLYGGDGDDIFIVEETATQNNDMAFIMDWADGDSIDIADLLGDYNEHSDDIVDFVNVAQGSHTTIQIDRDGAGTDHGWDNIVRLVGVTDLGTDVNTLIGDGTLGIIVD